MANNTNNTINSINDTNELERRNNMRKDYSAMQEFELKAYKRSLQSLKTDSRRRMERATSESDRKYYSDRIDKLVVEIESINAYLSNRFPKKTVDTDLSEAQIMSMDAARIQNILNNMSSKISKSTTKMFETSDAALKNYYQEEIEKAQGIAEIARRRKAQLAPIKVSANKVTTLMDKVPEVTDDMTKEELKLAMDNLTTEILSLLKLLD